MTFLSTCVQRVTFHCIYGFSNFRSFQPRSPASSPPLHSLSRAINLHTGSPEHINTYTIGPICESDTSLPLGTSLSLGTNSPPGSVANPLTPTTPTLPIKAKFPTHGKFVRLIGIHFVTLSSIAKYISVSILRNYLFARARGTNSQRYQLLEFPMKF